MQRLQARGEFPTATNELVENQDDASLYHNRGSVSKTTHMPCLFLSQPPFRLIAFAAAGIYHYTLRTRSYLTTHFLYVLSFFFQQEARLRRQPRFPLLNGAEEGEVSGKSADSKTLAVTWKWRLWRGMKVCILTPLFEKAAGELARAIWAAVVISQHHRYIAVVSVTRETRGQRRRWEKGIES